MADISVLARLLNGAVRNVDLTNNTPVVLSVKVGGGVSNTELTKAILDRLVALQNGSDVGTGYHTHDTVYTRTTALASSTGGSAGSTLIGDDNSYSNFTPSVATVKGALSAIDTALGASSNSANRSLSNLTSPTSINQDLLPSSDLSKNLGAASTKWSNGFINLLKDGSSVTSADLFNRQLKDSGGAASVSWTSRQLSDGAVNSVDWSTRQLFNSSSAVMASWSGSTIVLDAGASFNGNRAMNAADPVSGQDLVTLSYMNARLNGLTPKAPVVVATTANITLSGTQTIDTVAVVAGNRVLVKNQTAPENNGIYVVAAGAWSRSADMDSLTPFDEFNGAWTAVQQGSQAGQVFVQYGAVTVVGTDPVNFAYYNPIAGLIGGDMITFAGSTFSVDLAAVSGLESTNPGNVAGQLRIKLEASNPTLKITGSNELAAKLDPAGALASGAAGIATQVDASTIEISSNALRVKAAGITENHLATSVAGNGLSGGAGAPLAVNVDASTIEINADTLRIKDAGVTAAKLNTNVADQSTITGGAGTALAVQASPLVKRTLVAGESFAANTSFLVRWAISGETAGRVYKADKDASVSSKYMVIGIAQSASAVSAGQNISVVVLGECDMLSNDTAFSAGDIGKEVFLGASGAWILGTALANTTNEAQFCIGSVQDTGKIWVDSKQLRGIA